MPDDTYPSLHGKTCLVTDATSGIGLVTAAALAGLGARVVLTGRRPARLDQALRQIQQQHPAAEIHTLQADFADLAQVERLAAGFIQRFERLDRRTSIKGCFTG